MTDPMAKAATRRPDAARVAAARRWFSLLGYRPVEADGITAVTTPAHPDTWDANWVQAAADADAAAVFAALSRHHPTGWQTVVTDALTRRRSRRRWRWRISARR